MAGGNGWANSEYVYRNHCGAHTVKSGGGGGGDAARYEMRAECVTVIVEMTNNFAWKFSKGIQSS